MPNRAMVSFTRDNISNDDDDENTINIYPLRNYYFESKQPLAFKDETLSDRAQRMKTNYASYGMRTSVAAVLVVELSKSPHLLLLQVRNSFFELPGGRLRPGESEIEGLIRKLSRKLCANEDCSFTEWEVGECLGMWWRPDFETLMFPYLPSNLRKPKECTKIFIVKLPNGRRFTVPKNLKLLAVPLFEIHENEKTYGQIISGVPLLLSKFKFKVLEN